MDERFKMPTDQQLIEMAIVFNEGVIDRQKLADMVAYASLILDRLYENGDVLIQSKKEKE